MHAATATCRAGLSRQPTKDGAGEGEEDLQVDEEAARVAAAVVARMEAAKKTAKENKRKLADAAGADSEGGKLACSGRGGTAGRRGGRGRGRG